VDERKIFLGQQIAQRRKAKGWSLQQLAVQVGIKRQTLHMYEQGTAWPSLPTLLDLAVVLGCTPNDLLGLSDDPHGHPPA